MLENIQLIMIKPVTELVEVTGFFFAIEISLRTARYFYKGDPPADLNLQINGEI